MTGAVKDCDSNLKCGNKASWLANGQLPYCDDCKRLSETIFPGAINFVENGYYRGWSVTRNPKTNKLESACLCLFNYSTVEDLERAIDRAIFLRENNPGNK